MIRLCEHEGVDDVEKAAELDALAADAEELRQATKQQEAIRQRIYARMRRLRQNGEGPSKLAKTTGYLWTREYISDLTKASRPDGESES